MSLAPLLAAGALVLANATVAFAALAVGTMQLLRRKGTRSHRALGWLWIALMKFVAAGSFGIHALRQLGPFSWIHGLSAFTLAMLAMLALGIWHEAYRKAGGMEAIYLDMPKPIGLGAFAAAKAPTGPFMSSRERLAA